MSTPLPALTHNKNLSLDSDSVKFLLLVLTWAEKTRAKFEQVGKIFKRQRNQLRSLAGGNHDADDENDKELVVSRVQRIFQTSSAGNERDSTATIGDCLPSTCDSDRRIVNT